ncbi:alpha-amylase family protein [Bacteriovorax sp. Seq25_V]|uniref:alpha-amylase n=1 Tax=Bacteriovorax sp. Seq25_V TaxID=1201288 RepID=UPI00038A0CA6|nr:alpha-amylase family protein [Bacteriovorax sp. Seq25_V]EQC43990.1 alpha amylase, catalytic domain protein [Bacteriovorax sp. Seq25_V]
MTKFLTLLLLTVNVFAIKTVPRTVMVQLFEWKWSDIETECRENLGPNGFSAVQISPPHEHLNWPKNPWWERYQVVSYDLTSRSGTEAEFVEMIKTCQEHGVDIYADVILNHMTGMLSGTGYNGTKFDHYNYEGIYEYKDFHHCGKNDNDDILNFNDLYELQNCELLNLADLNTGSPTVQDKLASYLNKLISLGVKGFRIDAAKHIKAEEIGMIVRKLKKKVYIYQEVVNTGNDPFKVSDYIKNGDVLAYSYPYIIGNAFKNFDLGSLQNKINSLPSSMDAVVMVDNHDLQRHKDRNELLSANYEQKEFDIAQIFMLTYPYGYPKLYTGYKFNTFDEGPPLDELRQTRTVFNEKRECQAPFICEHKRSYINPLVGFRNRTSDSFYVSNWWTNGKDILAFGRGTKGFVVLNNSAKDLQMQFQTSLPAGSYCNILDVSCATKYVIDDSKKVALKIKSKTAVVLERAE